MNDTPRTFPSIAFIGAGTMAESMIGGLIHRGGIPPHAIAASHPRADRCHHLASTYGITVTDRNDVAVRDADLIFLTVKPQVLDSVLMDLAGVIDRDQVVVSVLAGTSINALHEGLAHPAIVRVMPNTPSQVGEGMAVWTATEAVSSTAREYVRRCLSALGEEIEVESEKYVDMATALSGTGPTYVFLMMEALIDAGVHLGFPRRIAEQIVMQTVAGSASYARASGKHLAELRNMVTSPGGTSAEAIYQMEKGGLRTILSKSVYAAYLRTQSLASERVVPVKPSTPIDDRD